MRRVLAVAVAALTVTWAWATVNFTVDANNLVKHVFPLNGVNAGPGHIPGGHADVTDQYREMGISLVRTHDYYGPCDLSTIFPSSYNANNPWGADEYDDSSYDFSDSDAAVKEIEDTGCDVMFRLGESWHRNPIHNWHPPNNKYGTVAHVCKHIAKHYGADEGRITLWEVWNEPNINMFWEQGQHANVNAALEEFFGLYSWIAQGLKDKFPNILVGGPGAAGGASGDILDFARKFLHACQIRNAPLDFYSWHSYNRGHEGPYVFAKEAKMIRYALNAKGFNKALNVLSEWNVCNVRAGGNHPTDQDREFKAMLWNMDGAAFSTAALTYLHLHSDVRYACRYRGDIHSGDHGYGLINTDGTIKKPGYAFKAYAMLFPQWNTVFRPEMYLLESAGGNLKDRTAMATTDGDRRVINVLISLWKCGGEGFKLTISNVPQGWTSPKMEHYVVSPNYDCEQVAKETPASTQPFVYEYGGQGGDYSVVHLVRVYDAAQFPFAVQVAPAPLNP